MRRTLVLLLLTCASTAGAQSPCFRGRPLPHCESFLITEFVWGRRFAPPGDDGGLGPVVVTMELGAMVNADPRTAWGVAVVASRSADRSHTGVRPRYRRWLGGETSFDVSAGVLVSGRHDAFRPRFPGFTAQVALSQDDIIGVILGADILRGGPAGASASAYGGVRFGSHAAPVAGAMFVLMVLLAIGGS